MNQQDILRLVEIENKLYYINMKDRWDEEDRKEYAKLSREREDIKRGRKAE